MKRAVVKADQVSVRSARERNLKEFTLNLLCCYSLLVQLVASIERMQGSIRGSWVLF